jgi:hypothetical protein
MIQIPACAVVVFLGLASPAANAGLYDTAAADVDHSRKSDRLSGTTVSVGSIDVSDASIVYGNRSGRLRFRTNRVTRTNIVLENATFPKPTPLETIDVPARGKTFEVDEPTPAQPAGCEAAAGLIADPTLARLVGRCFA